ncbi:alpha-2-macroglobulin family protein [Corallincola holothuriorum]|uniref:Alpha-2-macroglobulin n=2 Tax=Corallincola holothuriorum TaxID=2282215 RepID=A0A368NK29_9GAMM|nr:alpha-2-macroglobulin family protein [Corallincola holothuriorum]
MENSAVMFNSRNLFVLFFAWLILTACDSPSETSTTAAQGAALTPAVNAIGPDEDLLAEQESFYQGKALTLLQSGQRSVLDGPALALTFSVPLTPQDDWNKWLKASIKETLVNQNWLQSQDGKTLYLPFVEPEVEYKVQLAAGLLAINGASLQEAQTLTIKTRPLAAGAAFSSNGSVLPLNQSAKLPVTAINVDEVNVDFFRISQSYLPQLLSYYSPASSLDNYALNELTQQGERVYSGRFKLNTEANRRQTVLLPLSSAELQKAGVYFAVMTPLGDYSWAHQTTYFSVSDLGLHARRYRSNITLFTQSLSNGNAISQAKVELLNRKGELIWDGATDLDGRVDIPAHDKAALVLVTKDQQLATLEVSRQALDLSAFKLGDTTYTPQQFYLFAPRDLYRPGEQIKMLGMMRDADGRVLPGMSVQLKLTRPDGQVAFEKTAQPSEFGEFDIEYQIPSDALPGQWLLRLESAAGSIRQQSILIEEFLPERIKVELDDATEQQIVSATQAYTLKVAADYLYGAPADGNLVEAELTVSLARHPHTQWEKFAVGLADDEQRERWIYLNGINLNDAGTGELKVTPQQATEWRELKGPLSFQYLVSVYEEGGRAINRRQQKTLWEKEEQWPGIAMEFDPDNHADGKPAAFSLLNLDAAGTPISGEVQITLTNENRDYFWRYDEGSGWYYDNTARPYIELETRLNLDSDKPTRFAPPLSAGEYLLEVTNSQQHTSSIKFSIGHWGYQQVENLRPDMVKLSLDKASYQAGDSAELSIDAPYDGYGLVLIENSDRLLWWQSLPLDSAQREVSLPIDPAWQRHDLHISVLIAQPEAEVSADKPMRALGMIPLPLSRDERRFELALQAPEKALPLTELPIKLSLGNAKGSSAYAVIAAVDQGALNVSNYTPEDPLARLFGQKRFEIDLFDNYGRVIHRYTGHDATLRFGGDADATELKRGGELNNDVQIVSLWQGPVRFDINGEAEIPLDLPDFNGELHLMAFAFSDRQFALSESSSVIAAPIVAQLGAPRFLADGDQSQLALDLRNMTETEQTLSIKVETDKKLLLLKEALPEQITLQPQQKQTLILPVIAQGRSGSSHISMEIGNDELNIVRHWQVPMRPAYPAETRNERKLVVRHRPFTLSSKFQKGLDAETLQTQLVLDAMPPLSLDQQFKHLLQYPYGCLEQTTSRGWPLLATNSHSRAKLNLTLPDGLDPQQAIDAAITQLLAKQKGNGSFALWDNHGTEEPWLTVYATDFLLTAKDNGYQVPSKALTAAKDRLQHYLRSEMLSSHYSEAPNHTRLAYQAYAAYLLATQQQASLGTLRTLFDRSKSFAESPLPLVHLGIAFKLLGDEQRSTEALALSQTLRREENKYLADYGSPLRDNAIVLALLAEHGLAPAQQNDGLLDLADQLTRQRWLSTQDRAALLQLALQLDVEKDWRATMKLAGQAHRLQQTSQYTQLWQGKMPSLSVTTQGADSVYLDLTSVGYPTRKPKPVSDGMAVSRRYYDREGKPLNFDNIKVGDLVIVRLTLSASQRTPDALVVDALPAGFELENPNLTHSIQLSDLQIDNQPAWHEGWSGYVKHQEYRDDRYVGAIDLYGRGEQVLVYLMRAVTPGTYRVPPSYLEDMYRPNLRAISDTRNKLTVLPR